MKKILFLLSLLPIYMPRITALNFSVAEIDPLTRALVYGAGFCTGIMLPTTIVASLSVKKLREVYVRDYAHDAQANNVNNALEYRRRDLNRIGYPFLARLFYPSAYEDACITAGIGALLAAGTTTITGKLTMAAMAQAAQTGERYPVALHCGVTIYTIGLVLFPVFFPEVLPF